MMQYNRKVTIRWYAYFIIYLHNLQLIFYVSSNLPCDVHRNIKKPAKKRCWSKKACNTSLCDTLSTVPNRNTDQPRCHGGAIDPIEQAFGDADLNADAPARAYREDEVFPVEGTDKSRTQRASKQRNINADIKISSVHNEKCCEHSIWSLQKLITDRRPRAFRGRLCFFWSQRLNFYQYNLIKWVFVHYIAKNYEIYWLFWKNML